MNFLKRIADLFRPKASSERRYLSVYLLSRRCNELISGQVDLFNELSISEESDAAHYARKVFHGSGRNRCFDQVEVQLWFDANKNLLRHEESGGQWLTQEEFESKG
jgi:hypothetical protein